MNLGAISALAKFYYFGTSTPDASVVTYFDAASEGVIANIHRHIQEENDFWFMEDYHSASVAAYSRTAALPTNFKHEVESVGALAYSTDTYTTGTAACSATTAVVGTSTAWETSWSGRGYQISWDSVTWYTIVAVTSATALVLSAAGPTASSTYTIRKCSGRTLLEKLTPEQILAGLHDISGTSPVPLYYGIYENVMSFYPLPSAALTVDYRYFGYLARPTVFATHDDDLTDEAAHLIAFRAVAEISSALDDSRVQLFSQKADVELQRLVAKHAQRLEGGFSNLKVW